MKIEIKFHGVNWWGNKIYTTKIGTLLCYIENDGYYCLSNPHDMDSEPYYKIKSDKLIIVENFN